MRPIAYRARQIGAALTITAIAGFLTPAVHASAPSQVITLTESIEVEPTPENRTVLAPDQAFLTDETGELRLEVQFENTSDSTVSAQQLRILLDRTPVTQAKDLAENLLPANGLLGTPIATVDLPEAGPQTTVTTQVSLRGSSFPFAATDPAGVYLLRVLAGTEITASAPVVWRAPSESSTEETQTPLALIVPLTLPENISSLPRRDHLTTLMSPGGALDSLLNEAIAARATLAIDPRIIAGVRAYGTDVPTVATEWLERLRTANLPSFALQFSDADLSAQAQMDRSAPLVPTSLSFVTRHGSFPSPSADPTPTLSPDGAPSAEGAGADKSTPGATDGGGAETREAAEAESPGVEARNSPQPTTTPQPQESAQPDGGVPPNSQTPDVPALAEWSYSLPGVAWPALNSVNHTTLDFLQDQGFSTVLLSSSNVQLSPGTDLAGTADSQVLIRLDQTLMSAASSVLAAPTSAEQLSAESHLVAQLAIAHAHTPEQPLALALDRSLIGDSAGAQSMVQIFTELPWLTTAELPEGGTATPSLITRAVPDERLAGLRLAEQNVPLVAETAEVLVEPEYLTGLQTMRLLHFYRAGLTENPAEASSETETYLARDQESITGLKVESSATTQLIGSSSRVPVLVHNLLPFDASVTTLSAVSTPTLSVDEPRSSATVLPGDSDSNLFVPVTARVSSGETTLHVKLLDRNDAVVAVGDLPITVRSTWESLALGTLGGLVALFFGMGIWRSLRSRRDRAAEHTGE